jgi:hypothetical protein
MDTISTRSICSHSDDVVCRDIEGDLMIIPLTNGIGDFEDELFSLNPTGKAIWNKFNGETTIETIVHDLSKEYSAPINVIENDVIGLTMELLQRNMLTLIKQ